MPDCFSHGPCGFLVATLAAASVLAGCAGSQVPTAQEAAEDAGPFEIPEELLLDVGISIFDAPDRVSDAGFDSVFHNAEVLRAERNYVPYVVGKHLRASDGWGAVRVLARPSAAIDVTVAGSIVHSDGETLVFRARATDARGVQWFDNEYRASLEHEAYDGDPVAPDPFADAYAALAADMAAGLAALSLDDRARIRAVAELAFARSLAHDAFAKHVTPNPEGGHDLRRLPAEDDPTLGRVREIRHREHLVIDTVNDYYEDFTAGIQEPYDQWRREAFRSRQAQRELKLKVDAQVLLGSARIIAGLAQMDHDLPGRHGFGWVTLGLGLIRGAEYGEDQIRDSEEALRAVGVSTEAKVLPHATALENRTTRLQRDVDSRYNALREVLRRSYLAEHGGEWRGGAGESGSPPLAKQPSPDHPTTPKTTERRLLPPVASPPDPPRAIGSPSRRAPPEQRVRDGDGMPGAGDVQDALDLLNQLLDDDGENLGTLASVRIYAGTALGTLGHVDDQVAIAAFNEVVGAACATVCAEQAPPGTASPRRRHYNPLRPAVFQFLAALQDKIAIGEYDDAIGLLHDLLDARGAKPRSVAKRKVARSLGVYRLRPAERAAAYQTLARAYVGKRDYGNAIETYEKILALGRKAPPWHRDISNENLALIHFSRQDYGKSLKYQRAWLHGSEWLGRACPRVCPADPAGPVATDAAEPRLGR